MTTSIDANPPVAQPRTFQAGSGKGAPHGRRSAMIRVFARPPTPRLGGAESGGGPRPPPEAGVTAVRLTRPSGAPSVCSTRARSPIAVEGIESASRKNRSNLATPNTWVGGSSCSLRAIMRRSPGGYASRLTARRDVRCRATGRAAASSMECPRIACRSRSRGRGPLPRRGRSGFPVRRPHARVSGRGPT
jgi:hypothetical protein